MTTDADLLARYAASRDGGAFAELARRYLPLVYAAARRRTGDAALADDVCQAVFIVLAKKATVLHGRQPLGDWLLTVTRYAAANAVKHRKRRTRHETAAAKPEGIMSHANDEDDSLWIKRLDAALDQLPVLDRRALLLRYYNAADFSQIAGSMNISESAARKRVTRAVNRLRQYFAHRHVAVPVATLMMGLIASLSLTPPPALAASVAAVGVAAPAGPAALLAKGALHAMLTAKLKVAAILAIVLTAIAGEGVGLIAIVHAKSSPPATASAAPIAGWLKTDYRGSAAQTPATVYFEPSTGRRVTMYNNPAKVESFFDPVNQVAGKLSMGAFIFGLQSKDDVSFPVPYIEAPLLAEFEKIPGARPLSPAVADGAERVTTLTIDRSAVPAESRSGLPEAFEIHTEAATGLVLRVIASATDGKPGYDAYITTRVSGPPIDLDHPEKLKFPDGVTVVDNRPSPEIHALLQRLNDIVDHGLGVSTYAVITRFADPYTGDFDAKLDSVTLCSGDAKRFVIATWAFDKTPGDNDVPPIARPEGWPRSSLRQILAAVGQARPKEFVVFDGTTCWTDAPKGLVDPTRLAGRIIANDPNNRFWLTRSVPGKLWGAIQFFGLSLDTRLTLSNGPDGRRILEASTLLNRAAATTNPSVAESSTVRWTFFPDLGPYPLKIETDSTAYRSARAIPHFLQTTDISPNAGWMFRDPLRVPDHWSTTTPGDSEPGLMQYDTLVPGTHGEHVPTTWFDDPAKTWPE